MNRRGAIVTGIAGITATVAVPPRANAEASPEANPDLDQILALLQAHDEAFTNQDLDRVMGASLKKPRFTRSCSPALKAKSEDLDPVSARLANKL